MSNIVVVVQQNDVYLRIAPYNRKAFFKFLNLFPSPSRFDNATYGSLRFILQTVREFCTAETQKTCFDKFSNSIAALRDVGYTLTPLRPQPFLHAYKCHSKLRNLIFGNSVLLQHFGIEDPGFSILPCSYLNLKEYHLCKTHTRTFSRSEAIVNGHVLTNDEELGLSFSVNYDFDELQKGYLSGDAKIRELVSFLCVDAQFMKEWSKKCKLVNLEHDFAFYDAECKVRLMKEEDKMLLSLMKLAIEDDMEFVDFMVDDEYEDSEVDPLD